MRRAPPAPRLLAAAASCCSAVPDVPAAMPLGCSPAPHCAPGPDADTACRCSCGTAHGCAWAWERSFSARQPRLRAARVTARRACGNQTTVAAHRQWRGGRWRGQGAPGPCSARAGPEWGALLRLWARSDCSVRGAGRRTRSSGHCCWCTGRYGASASLRRGRAVCFVNARASWACSGRLNVGLLRDRLGVGTPAQVMCCHGGLNTVCFMCTVAVGCIQRRVCWGARPAHLAICSPMNDWQRASEQQGKHVIQTHRAARPRMTTTPARTRCSQSASSRRSRATARRRAWCCCRTSCTVRAPICSA